MLIDWYLHKIEYFLLCEWCEDMFNTHIESNQSKKCSHWYEMQNEDGKSNAGSDVGSDVGSDDGSEEGSPVNKRRGRGRSVDDIIDDEDVIIVLKPL